MTWEMYEALVDACGRVDEDPDVRVLIVRSTGDKAFIAGTDIAQFKDFSRREDGLEYEHKLDGVLDRLERVTKPTIAQVQGVAAGGGGAVAPTRDLRGATPQATVGVSIFPTPGERPFGGSYNPPLHLVGPRVLKEPPLPRP